MSQETEKLESLFEAAAAIEPGPQRTAYLVHACPEPALRLELDSLLEAHDHPDPIFSGETVRAQPLAFEAVGQQVGRYKLLESLGEGGCGSVYVAEQSEPIRRRVALKIIKLGMDTRAVVARFEAERQALAMMDHPNIAKILDAGVVGERSGIRDQRSASGAADSLTSDLRPLIPGSGRPYFVMELVRGVRITDYCDANHLGTKDRLGLFIKVCHAIQHAHQKGIIHRDIKPSNILVTLHDGVPVPKVIDFGIAKAMEGRLTEATVYTQLHHFIGTPAYMSPEQAEMSGLDIDTRSDIYSLGVLLYELLAGSTPFDAQELAVSGIDGLRKTIREMEPVRPSTRLATLPGAELTSAARRRSAGSSELLHQLKGDLDWIVMKCLEKDRCRRYDTANALAEDVARYLRNDPVLARPPSNLYRLKKLVRRNRTATTSVAGVALALLLGAGLAVSALLRERTQTARTEAVTGFIYQSLASTMPVLTQQGNFRAARTLLESTEGLLSSSLSNAPEAELAVRYQLWRTLIEQLQDYPGALRQAEAIGRLAPAIQRRARGQEQDELRLFLGLTRLWAAEGDAERQAAAMNELDSLCNALLARQPPSTRLAGECRAMQGEWLMTVNRMSEAEPRLAQAIELIPADPASGRRLHEAVVNYAEVLLALRKPDRAEAVISDNLDSTPGSEPEARAIHLGLIAQRSSALCSLGRFDDAEAMLVERSQRWMDHGGVASDLLPLESLRGAVLARSGKLREALVVFETLATNPLSGLGEWQAAAASALAVGDADAYSRLTRVAVLRFASVAEERIALVFGDLLLRQPSDVTMLTVARGMVNRVTEARDWSRDYGDLLRAALAHREQRFAEALDFLDRFDAQTRFGIVRASTQHKPLHRADVSYLRAMLFAELGRMDEARQAFAEGQEHWKRALASQSGVDLGRDWSWKCLVGVRQKEAETRLRDKGVLLAEPAAKQGHTHEVRNE